MMASNFSLRVLFAPVNMTEEGAAMRTDAPPCSFLCMFTVEGLLHFVTAHTLRAQTDGGNIL